MCRLLGYLGPTIQLEEILYKPKHSLIVQSYQPLEMQEALLNADGYGVGWYHPTRHSQPFIYRSISPIWNDQNLPPLSRYVESNGMLAYVRSATPGQAVNLVNCQPFQSENLLFTHNGYIDQFRQTLHRPMRDRLSNPIYEKIEGTTDSEHIFGLFLQELASRNSASLEHVLEATLKTLTELAQQVKVLATVLISDGQQMVASRFALSGTAPTLYWLKNDPQFPDAVIFASEPLFPGEWHPCPEQTIVHVGEDRDIHFHKLP
ncbi:MAG: ergothioneine biosynthesis protein EgtC [Oscillatoriales cyanobacterium RM2_1_1]|nr:ergothioneine biosynthesis protein EgtC [Oscillatoriales cyanobacterium SM2_3_0]NJO46565.1 ergothioneine biosynthesis protein EgtC [Oscillatoriales cyanobacterium RM2_1_1]